MIFGSADRWGLPLVRATIRERGGERRATCLMLGGAVRAAGKPVALEVRVLREELRATHLSQLVGDTSASTMVPDLVDTGRTTLVPFEDAEALNVVSRSRLEAERARRVP